MSTLTVAPAAVARENRVLADRLGGTILREIALVAAGTIAMIVLARRGLVSVAAYALLGIAGAPVFTGSNVGWAFASFGYILGYFLVAAIAGLAAQRGADRRVLTMAPVALASLFSVYVAGLAWMIPFTHMTLAQGLAKGFVPFIIGDLVKAAVAAGVFPMLRSFFR